jgi:CHAT domain-containing protein/Tfp pilus assembly protein PilF
MPVAAQTGNVGKFEALNEQAVQLYKQGKYTEAAAIAEQSLALVERTLGRDHPHALTAVNNLAMLYKALGRYDEAGPLYRRALETRERVLGREHHETLTSVSNLASLYRSQGRHGDAEPLYRRALEARERLLGREHPDTLRSINNLAVLYLAQGRYAEAEPLYDRALKAYNRTRGGDDPDTLTSVSNLAWLYKLQGRYDEAEPLYRRALEARTRALGEEHPDTLSSISSLASLHLDQGRYGEAEALYRRTLEARERLVGRDHPDTLGNIGSLATALYGQGRYPEAEPLFRRAVEALERTLGHEHPSTLVSIKNLASVYDEQGRFGEAEPLFKRTLDARERILGRNHPDTLDSVNGLASLYYKQKRYGEAEPLYRQALEVRERVLGRDHPDTLMSAGNLGSLYSAQRRYGEAEALLRRVLDARARLLGDEHPATLTSVSNLALLYYEQDRYGEAEPLYRRAIEAKGRVIGRDHPDTLISINNLAALYFLQRNWPKAAQLWREGTAAIAARTERGALLTGQMVGAKAKSEVERRGWQFSVLVKTLFRLTPDGHAPDESLARETFQIAQWALGSQAAQSVAQMAARGAQSDTALATLVRERQDSLAEWQRLDVLRSAALGLDAAKRDAKLEAGNAARLKAIDTRVAQIDKRLAADFPDYFALASPQPLSVEEAQAQLHPDEALVLFLDTKEWTPAPEETFVWVLTKTQMRWVRSELGTTTLTREVQALRCGLDATAWDGKSRCPDLTGERRPGKQLPFDLNRAHGLYRALFGQVEDVIKGKHLLLVLSGSLTQLPISALVTAPPASRDNRAAAWLARDHAITVLPAVSSLKALRRIAHPSKATKPLIGFANPLLEGAAGDGSTAKLAREKQRCEKSARQGLATLFRLPGAISQIETRGGLADVASIRALPPLPETADELCAVASDIGADLDEMRLGARATEREIKKLSKDGRLAQYRIVHFATHGAMAGELSGSSEPGLVLTPPKTASDDDDGYLSASEITALKLDADWVILSACNTAAGSGDTAETLSGLARAFIYAQARALLVSHWAVDSNATMKLITSAIREVARNKSIGRAEAVRLAMLGMIDNGETAEAHPAMWAPFVVVGEGSP